MGAFHLMKHIFLWHYTRGFVDFFHIWKNFLGAIYRVFSIPDLFRTLFAPWRRLEEPYTKPEGGIDFEQFFGAIVVNSMTRLVGFFARTFFIILGFFFFSFALFVGFVFLLFWFCMPLVIVAFFLYALILLFF